MPVSLKLTAGLPVLLSATEIAAGRVPPPVGVKVTPIVQLPFTANVPQWAFVALCLVTAFAPVMPMLGIVSGVFIILGFLGDFPSFSIAMAATG